MDEKDRRIAELEKALRHEEAMELAELKVGVNDRSMMETATVCLYQEVRSLRSRLAESVKSYEDCAAENAIFEHRLARQREALRVAREELLKVCAECRQESCVACRIKNALAVIDKELGEG